MKLLRRHQAIASLQTAAVSIASLVLGPAVATAQYLPAQYGAGAADPIYLDGPLDPPADATQHGRSARELRRQFVDSLHRQETQPRTADRRASEYPGSPPNTRLPNYGRAESVYSDAGRSVGRQSSSRYGSSNRYDSDGSSSRTGDRRYRDPYATRRYPAAGSSGLSRFADRLRGRVSVAQRDRSGELITPPSPDQDRYYQPSNRQPLNYRTTPEYGGPVFPGDMGPMDYDGLPPEYEGHHSELGDDCTCLGCRATGFFSNITCPDFYGGGLGMCSWPDNAQVFVGVHGFKGPLDEGQSSNFGFQEGFNLAGPIPCSFVPNLGFQIGYQAVQSQLSGTVFDNNIRDQDFFTFGFFRRDPLGCQWGIVWDFLDDDYRGKQNLSQIRLEGALANCDGNEFGLWTALHTNDDYYVNGSSQTQRIKAVDQFAGFYRWRIRDSANLRVWAGLTSDGEGLLGSDTTVPMTDCLALRGSFNYLIPKHRSPPLGATQEEWNVGLNFVWYIGGKSRYTEFCSPYRPMFDVADNGTFFVD